MSQNIDFRLIQSFSLKDLDKSAKHVGRTAYWKLYSIENLFRLIVNSVLFAQLDKDWWSKAVNPTTQRTAIKNKNKYKNRPWHTSPGLHDIYYIDLFDLNEIIRVNSGSFLPVIDDIDQWIVKIETIRFPRNIVAHMNFPNKKDVKRIDIFYDDLVDLIKMIQGQNKIVFRIP